MTVHAAPIRVVLVDDQELFRGGVSVVVDAQPDMAVVGEAGNGAEALDVIERTGPDVVLMDLRMPVMDGVEATRRLFAEPRAGSGGTRPRVIVLTTFSLDTDAATAIRHGASGFLLKDSTPEFLCAAIRAVHGGGSVVSVDDLGTLLAAAAPPVTTAPVPKAFETLTEREGVVFAAAARGLSNAEIAAEQFLSESTVKTHVSSVLAKLGLRDRVQLVVFAHTHGLSG